LRWTLSQLRRALRGHAAVGGDPVVVRLGPGCRVDVTSLLDGRDGGPGDGAADGPDLPEVLLDGADGIAGPDFDLWLTAARHRVDAARGVRLRRAAERALAAAEPSTAVTAAARALVAEPHQAAARATLVGSLVAAGDHAAALAQLRQWSAWIRQELRIGRLMGDTGAAATTRPRATPTSSAGSKPGSRPWPRALGL
jgi:DNA-binding SARP family transcriptional activator